MVTQLYFIQEKAVSEPFLAGWKQTDKTFKVDSTGILFPFEQ